MLRALIVEDEDLMREYLGANLHALCPEWEAAALAADGIDALEQLAAAHFDAVITDIRMPGMDGLELAQVIRTKNPNMPILFLSGYDDFEYARTAVRLNVFDYLLKPLQEEELFAALHAMAAQIIRERHLPARPPAKAERAAQELIDKIKMPSSDLVRKAYAYLCTHFSEPISLTTVADELHVNPAYLSTVFHRDMGISYSQALLRLRMEHASKLLLEYPVKKVRDISEAVGFPSAKHFTHVFGQFYNLSPVEFRAKNQNNKNNSETGG